MALTQRDPVSGALTLNMYATGPKRYGANGSTTATAGPVAKAGYQQRERDRAKRRAALQRRLAQPGPYDQLGGA